MEKTLQELVELILKALPTFVLVVLLHFYLKYVFFRPLERVLKARNEATEGARQLAEQSLARAAQKTAEYEAALQAARTEIYREQEQFRQRLRQEQVAAVEQARREAGSLVEKARTGLQAELTTARQTLRADTESLAARIVEQILYRRPA